MHDEGVNIYPPAAIPAKTFEVESFTVPAGIVTEYTAPLISACPVVIFITVAENDTRESVTGMLIAVPTEGVSFTVPVPACTFSLNVRMIDVEATTPVALFLGENVTIDGAPVSAGTRNIYDSPSTVCDAAMATVPPAGTVVAGVNDTDNAPPASPDTYDRARDALIQATR